MKRRRTLLAKRKQRRSWHLYVIFLGVLAITFFFLGLGTLELWLLVLVIYYLFWVTRKE